MWACPGCLTPNARVSMAAMPSPTTWFVLGTLRMVELILAKGTVEVRKNVSWICSECRDTFVFKLKIIFKQEVKESFASPNYLFYGKSHTVKQLHRKNGCKKPFLFAFITATRGNGPKWNPAQIDAQTTLFIPRSRLSGLILWIGRYLATTKGCRMRYFKDRQL